MDVARTVSQLAPRAGASERNDTKNVKEAS